LVKNKCLRVSDISLIGGQGIVQLDKSSV